MCLERSIIWKNKMEMCRKYCLVQFYTKIEYEIVYFNQNTTCEEICSELCKKNEFKPLSNTLFSLRNKCTGLFSTSCGSVEPEQYYEFRLRYKLVNLSLIKSLDKNAFNYFYHQTKYDLINEHIPELKYPKHKKKVVGLGVTSMLVDILEKKILAANCKEDWKNYLPAKYVQKHKWFLKKVVSDELKLIKNLYNDVG